MVAAQASQQRRARPLLERARDPRRRVQPDHIQLPQNAGNEDTEDDAPPPLEAVMDMDGARNRVCLTLKANAHRCNYCMLHKNDATGRTVGYSQYLYS
jgi:hypothetical protein